MQRAPVPEPPQRPLDIVRPDILSESDASKPGPGRPEGSSASGSGRPAPEKLHRLRDQAVWRIEYEVAGRTGGGWQPPEEKQRELDMPVIDENWGKIRSPRALERMVATNFGAPHFSVFLEWWRPNSAPSFWKEFLSLALKAAQSREGLRSVLGREVVDLTLGGTLSKKDLGKMLRGDSPRRVFLKAFLLELILQVGRCKVFSGLSWAELTGKGNVERWKKTLLAQWRKEPWTPDQALPPYGLARLGKEGVKSFVERNLPKDTPEDAKKVILWHAMHVGDKGLDFVQRNDDAYNKSKWMKVNFPFSPPAGRPPHPPALTWRDDPVPETSPLFYLKMFLPAAADAGGEWAKAPVGAAADGALDSSDDTDASAEGPEETRLRSR
eukprot:g11093.t1